MAEVKYVRIEHQIFCEGDTITPLQSFPSISQAKQWARAQETKEPGSVRAGAGQQRSPDQLRNAEIAALILSQNRDRAEPTPGPVAQPYVMQDRNSSSFLRERTAQPRKSRNARNSRARAGGS